MNRRQVCDAGDEDCEKQPETERLPGQKKMRPAAIQRSGAGGVILLDLQGPVFLSEPAYKVEFSNNSGGLVDCTGHGSPPPDVEWSVATTNHELVYTMPNGSLIFYPFSADKFRHEIHSTVYSPTDNDSSAKISPYSRNMQMSAANGTERDADDGDDEHAANVIPTQTDVKM
uniref:Ig-like domain-containing protein n=1 Tax=Anopheles atroparvus TaxID=41427 RepID=A0A182J542_ANOAO